MRYLLPLLLALAACSSDPAPPLDSGSADAGPLDTGPLDVGPALCTPGLSTTCSCGALGTSTYVCPPSGLAPAVCPCVDVDARALDVPAVDVPEDRPALVDAGALDASQVDAGADVLPPGCVSTTVGNCCGVACPAPPHATPACVGGSCGVGSCTVGFADCDRSPSNGCEVDLESSPANCGACGAPCAAGRACERASCVECPAGQRSCGGPCMDVTGDRSNCGGCDVVCPERANAAPTCAAGSCGFICNAGFADCDGDASNGCEVSIADNANCGGCGRVCTGGAMCVGGACACPTATTRCDGTCLDTRSDANNCGGCGRACSTVGGGATCVMGTCRISCAVGLGNCDGNVANGCETNTTTSLANCGACGRTCAAAGGTASCSSGTCVATCPTGLTHCGTACVDVSSDATNCGECRRVCPTRPYSSPSCRSGTCAITCQPSVGDCNGNPVDGCETAVAGRAAGDVNNCGACGRICSLPGATARCNEGVCVVASCTSGLNCDGIDANGCETEPSSDVMNCGGCGRACATGAHATGVTCTNGRCVRTCLAGYADCIGAVAGGCTVDTQQDSSNCGACGTRCTNGRLCIAGRCGCGGGGVYCDGTMTCSDLRRDARNCGGCGVNCVALGLRVCSGGNCGP